MARGQRRSLLELFDFDEIGPDRWNAPTPPEGPPRLFGGQVAAQALMAACRTVGSDRLPHSLHGYFIRPGRPNSPLELVVERMRDGRSFTTRHVTAVQRNQAIFELTASFHADEGGFDWYEPGPTGIPSPDDIPSPEGDSPFGPFWANSPFEIRPVHRIDRTFSVHPCWVRVRESLGDDRVLQACALTFISDLAVVSAARAPTNRAGLPTGASLDHAVWFHRTFDANDWLLFSADPVSNHADRGLARGSFHTTEGVLVATMSQESLLRSIVGRPPPGGEAPATAP